MAARSLVSALAPLALLTLAGAACAADTQVYRYTDSDGRIVYSDRAPPGSARNVQPKRLGANYIETSQMPLAAQQAVERFPVTLYTYDCGDVCQNAEALLNRRGVPFSTVDVTQGENGAKLQALTGEQRVPVLQVGDQVVKGYLEPKWQAALDTAGYPKTPAQKRNPTPRVPEAQPAPAAQGSVATPAKGTDYPK
jgi:glutaredoxin